MRLRIDRGITRRRLALVLVGFALLYGFFMVNFVDSTYASTSNPASSQSSCPLPPDQPPPA